MLQDDKTDKNIKESLEKELDFQLKGLNSLLKGSIPDVVLDANNNDVSMDELLQNSVLINNKHLNRDPTMNIVSSERKLKSWLQSQHLASSGSSSYTDGLPMDVLMERIWDTMEDIMVHVRRKDYENGKVELSPEEEESRKTVVVLGSGWGAHALMKVADCQKLRLIVVSPSNHFVFTPMLASAAVGTVEYRSMSEAVRSANPMIDDYLEGQAIDVDVEKKTIKVQMNSLLNGIREGDPPVVNIPYDHLVCSVGCQVNTWGIPGAENALKLKSLDDARVLRRSIAECLEYASRPDVAGDDQTDERIRRATFLIVGGGPTGVELAGEILDLVADVTEPKGSYPRLKDNVRVVIAHADPNLLAQFEPNLRAEAFKSLQKKGAEVMLNTKVMEVGDGFADLSTSLFDDDGNVIGQEDFRLPLGLTAWCAGTAPAPFVSTLLQQLPEDARNRDGRVKVDRWLRPPMPRPDLVGSVFVLGDAAAFDSDAAMLPQTAQVAGQEGAFLARLLDRGYDTTATPPTLPERLSGDNSTSVFDDAAMQAWLDLRGLDQAPGFIFFNLGILAYLGGGEGKALVDTGWFSLSLSLLLASSSQLLFPLCKNVHKLLALSQVQLGDFPLFSYFGSVAFVLWRSVYLVKQVATRNRVLVAVDWIKSHIFGRDVTRF